MVPLVVATTLLVIATVPVETVPVSLVVAMVLFVVTPVSLVDDIAVTVSMAQTVAGTLSAIPICGRRVALVFVLIISG